MSFHSLQAPNQPRDNIQMEFETNHILHITYSKQNEPFGNFFISL